MTEKIKVTGAPLHTEHPIFGERVTLIVHGSFDRRAQTVDEHGTVSETYTFTVEDIAEPGEDLVEAAYERIQIARDRISGGTRLPLEEAVEEFVNAMDDVAGEGNWSMESGGGRMIELLTSLCDGPPVDGPDHHPYDVENGRCGCGALFLRCGCPIGEAHAWCEDEDRA